ncbi:hypothetical protein DMC30DRAFT_152417 [Rhodotorula diobovata]|uniref:Uncharacterized protein n=1 Tax=Rhodotorula diobovata TaxID=5288 RepID=A0A5C5G086_9BASI|nr:hypothetical protein DMC30DRAFT_152417 [Rhodotorula diobovata]
MITLPTETRAPRTQGYAAKSRPSTIRHLQLSFNVDFCRPHGRSHALQRRRASALVCPSSSPGPSRASSSSRARTQRLPPRQLSPLGPPSTSWPRRSCRSSASRSCLARWACGGHERDSPREVVRVSRPRPCSHAPQRLTVPRPQEDFVRTLNQCPKLRYFVTCVGARVFLRRACPPSPPSRTRGAAAGRGGRGGFGMAMRREGEERRGSMHVAQPGWLGCGGPGGVRSLEGMHDVLALVVVEGLLAWMLRRGTPRSTTLRRGKVVRWQAVTTRAGETLSSRGSA